MRAIKGHGTENDFVVLPDLDGAIELSSSLVRAICDRHGGIGADGVLRVVRSENHPEAKELAGEAEFFMDYRNADGSVAEMCGNGVRVFVRYLATAGLADGVVAVATRGGVKRTERNADGTITVDMGTPELLSVQPIVHAPGLAGTAGTALQLPNPHIVVPVSSVEILAGLDLSRPPTVAPTLPTGQNVEFVVRSGDQHLSMRVHERGVGETRSCGTGICAAVVASGAPDGTTWRVDVPGGTCAVVWRADGHVELTGPAVLVAEVELNDGWLAAHR